MYDLQDDWDGDEHHNTCSVHYRLYLNSYRGIPVVICVQDFDYFDYDARLILSPQAWNSESDAEEALLIMLPMISEESQKIPYELDRDLRSRVLARAVRNSSERV